MSESNAIPVPVFLPVLEEEDDKEDLCLNSLEARQYERECVQRVQCMYGML